MSSGSDSREGRRRSTRHDLERYASLFAERTSWLRRVDEGSTGRGLEFRDLRRGCALALAPGLFLLPEAVYLGTRLIH